MKRLVAVAALLALTFATPAKADVVSWSCLDARIDILSRIIDVDNVLIFDVDQNTQPKLWMAIVRKRIAIAREQPKECGS